jgi:NADH-quinone oxidoreductase subunit N
MFSLTGLPPTMGFFAKLFVLQAALDAGYTWLVVVAVLLSVVGAFYYLRIVKIMYMDSPAPALSIAPRADVRWVLSATAVITLALGVFPSPLLDLCVRAITASM